MLKLKKCVPYILIFIILLFLYRQSLTTFFSQDDFFHIKIAQTDGSVAGFIKLFRFSSFEVRSIAFYRPVFREVLFNIFYSLFGLQVLAYRIFAFAVYFIDVILVSVFFEKLFSSSRDEGQKLLPIFIAFFFGLTSANVATLFYFTGGIQTLGVTAFILLSLIYFFDYLNSYKKSKKVLSFIFFILALGSHELAVVILPLFVGLIFLKTKNFKDVFIQSIKELWFPGLLLLLYLYLDFKVIGFSKGEVQYHPIFSVKTFVNSLGWYALWSLGLPEMLIDFVQPGLKLAPQLMRYWGDYFKIIFPSFFISSSVLILSSLYLFFQRRAVFKDKKFWFLLFWFPASLLPVVFLEWHKSTYYLFPALPAFWGLVGYILFHLLRFWERAALTVFIIFTFFLSVASIRLGESTYWAATRGRLAEKLLKDIKVKYPNLPAGSILYIKDDPNYPFVAEDWGGTSKQASLILNGSDAVQLLYKDPSLKVAYEDEKPILTEKERSSVFTLVAKF